MTRKEMLCAVSYLMDREAEALLQDPTPEHVFEAHFLSEEANKVAIEGGEDLERWQKAVRWVEGR